MKKRIRFGLLALTIFLGVVASSSLIIAYQSPVFIGVAADYPPLYTPPTEIEGCYVYDICLMYRWKKPPCDGERVFYEEGWSGQAHKVFMIDVDGGIPTVTPIYAMRESFGKGCLENKIN